MCRSSTGDGDGTALGTIGIWETEHDGAAIHETGWMVLPARQGRGIARAALALLIDRARGEPRAEQIHAFPGLDNAASNALYRGAGFVLLGERQVEFSGRPLRVDHRRLDLRG